MKGMQWAYLEEDQCSNGRLEEDRDCELIRLASVLIMQLTSQAFLFTDLFIEFYIYKIWYILQIYMTYACLHTYFTQYFYKDTI